MPTPHKGESRKDFVSRCIPVVMEDGTAKDSDQAVAVCNSMWREAKKERAMTNEVTINIGTGETPADVIQQEIQEAWETAPRIPVEISVDQDASLKDRLFQAVSEIFTKAPMKTVDGKKYPAGDFLVVEDPQSPSTWHLQVKNNGKVNHQLLGAAWAALHGGYRGNKYQGPGKADALKKLKALYKSEDMETPGTSKGFMLWKEADGSYRWLARYSNNFRDEDDPPEIISATSHKQFDQMLTKAEVDMPDLWLWHRPEWKWGTTTWHAYDDAGFALAGGIVDKGQEPLADHLMELDPALIRVSHGMPTKSIVRDTDDDSVIVGHVTREISPLPAWAAANQRTGFILLKEATDMTIPQEKRDALKEEWNLSDELLNQLEAANTADAKEADEAGIEHKEVETTETEAEAETEPISDPEPEPAVSRAEMTEALETIGQAVAALAGKIDDIQGQVIEVKEEKSVEEAATLTEIFERAIGHPDARVDGRTKDAKDRPAETKPEPEQIVNTGNPMSDSIINSIVSGEFMAGLRGEQAAQ